MDAPGVMAAAASQSPCAPLLLQEVWWDWFSASPGGLSYERVEATQWFAGVSEDELARAASSVLARHEVLRMSFQAADGGLEARLAPVDSLEITRGRVGAAESLQAVAGAFLRHPISVRDPKLVRTIVIGAPGGCLLVLQCHHIIADTASIGILMRQVRWALGLEPRPTPCELQDNLHAFGSRQRAWVETGGASSLQRHWSNWISAGPALHSPGGQPLDWAPGVKRSIPFAVHPRLDARLKHVAAAAGVTPFIVWLAAFGLALARWAGLNQAPVRCIGDFRTSRELLQTVGMLVCADPVRLHIPGDLDLRSFLDHVAREYREARNLRLPTLPSRFVAGQEPLHHRIAAALNFTAHGGATVPLDRLKAPSQGPPIGFGPPTDEVFPVPLITIQLRVWRQGDAVRGRLEVNSALLGEDDQIALRHNLASSLMLLSEAA